MRKYFIDNLRIICIFLLFPYHTAMIYNNFGEFWYVKGNELLGAGLFICVVEPWWMSLLFVLAGISASYALENRTGKQYLIERTKKLLIPFISALLFIVPLQIYYADRFYNQFSGTYLEHMSIFFQITDLCGNDGHFTPGHTWFILYLFIISAITLPLFLWYQKREKKIKAKKITIPKLIPVFFIILLSALILDIGGKSMGEFCACFLAGYFLLSDDVVLERLQKNWIPLSIAALVLMIMRGVLAFYGLAGQSEQFYLMMDIQNRLYGWIGILALLAIFKRFFNRKYRLTKYFAPAAFPLYFFHQSVIVLIGFYIVNRLENAVVEYFIIMLLSFAGTVICYEIAGRFRITRFLFGIKSINRTRRKNYE